MDHREHLAELQTARGFSPSKRRHADELRSPNTLRKGKASEPASPISLRAGEPASSGLRLDTLPPWALMDILSFLTYSSERLKAFAVVGSGIREIIADQTCWRHLCRTYWRATDARLVDWPTLSPQALYTALEKWLPTEGFYVLAPAFPWGLLVLVRLLAGRVEADVLRFVPRSGSHDFHEVRVPLFRVSLEQGNGGVKDVVTASWGSDEPPGSVIPLDPRRLCSLRRIPHSDLFRSTELVNAGYIQPARAIRVTPCWDRSAEDHVQSPQVNDPDGPEDEDDDSGPEHEDDDSGLEDDDDDSEVSKALPSWATGRLPETPEAARELTQRMLRELHGHPRRYPCDLALVRSPAEAACTDTSFPGVRPGLYVGDYGHAMYGQYRTEVLLLEYVTLRADELGEELESQSRLFNRPGACATSARRRLPAELLQLPRVDTTFVRVVKQCGDFHVPCGATTFVALGAPTESGAALAQGKLPPRTVRSRSSGEPWEVMRAWRGVGALSFPGFENPSWDGGWLVQLFPDSFAFAWDRDGNQEAVALRWIGVQDECPFLQRSWLPEDLQ